VDIVLLGPQGSGKGTQAKRIARDYGIPHIATGDIIRELKEQDTDLGREVRTVYDRGDLVSDELMVRLIKDRLGHEDAREGFVLDGFPRTLAQAEALDALLRDLGRKPELVLEFRVGDRRILLDRIRKRAAEEHRSDDSAEAVERRLALYHEQTEPLVEHYRSRYGNVVGVHADRSIDEVYDEVQAALDQVPA
jgi:adenylate kinase